jgi:phosphoribosyl 1,2-cyclic phosphodiesterase
MTEICALASGSNGNSYYIGNENEAILIDIGIYYKKLIERIESAGLDINKIKAAFISHEHTDHVLGAKATSKRMGIPVYYSKKTYRKCYEKHKAEHFAFFNPGISLQIGHLNIFPFLKNHDAADPCSFRIENEGVNVGVMTDIGISDTILETEFSKCDVVFLETNYDEEMLLKGIYPYYLKQRIISEKGHLSNNQAKELVEKHASGKLKTIFLSHISLINNNTEIIDETFAPLSHKYNIKHAPRNKNSEVLRIM